MKTTFETTKEIIEKGNKKEIFNTLYLVKSDDSECIFDFIAACSNSFCKDIAKNAMNYLSEKQAWCLVFEIEKIKHQYDAYVESELKKI